jgi:ketosteroid isomerase-like protein
MEEIYGTLSKFITAFSKLDLEKMMTCFTNKATSFFPIAHQTTILEGKNEICNAFANVINKIRAEGLSSIILKPEDVKIQRFGETAVATFHIRNSELSRRTLVLRKMQNSWHIQHLHASNAPMEETQ